MRFKVEDEGVGVPIPRVTGHPVYGLFAGALLIARNGSGGSGAREIRLKIPDILTGHLGIEVGSAPASAATVVTDEDPRRSRSPLDGGVRHVALMRPAELVVRYLEVPNARADNRPWAGAFVCSDDPDIHSVFAAAEPPAHDDWIPERIDNVVERRLVNRTVNHLIPTAVRDAFTVASHSTGASTSDAPSLAAAADGFSKMFLSGPAGTDDLKEQRRNVKLARGARISRPSFVGLVVRAGTKVAQYHIRLTGVTDGSVRIRASATIALDGLRLDDDVPPDLARPEIIGWRGPGALIASNQNQTDVVCGGDGDFVFDVAFRGEYAIAVSCEVVK
jgi:hypothetical protein